MFTSFAVHYKSNYLLKFSLKFIDSYFYKILVKTVAAGITLFLVYDINMTSSHRFDRCLMSFPA